MVATALVVTAILMHGGLGRTDAKAKFRHMFSKNRAINVLAAARIFLFASRDVWFVVGLPVYLRTRARLELLGGRRVPGRLGDRLRHRAGLGAAVHQAQVEGEGREPDGRTATWLAFVLAAFPAGIAIALGGRLRSDHRARRRPDRVRRGLRDELRRALVPDPLLRRERQGRDERRLLLHGQRRSAGSPAPCSRACSTSGRASRPACGRRRSSSSRRARSRCRCRPTRRSRWAGHARTSASRPRRKARKPAIGFEPMTPSLRVKCSTN